MKPCTNTHTHTHTHLRTLTYTHTKNIHIYIQGSEYYESEDERLSTFLGLTT